jgi:hypothetical protein
MHTAKRKRGRPSLPNDVMSRIYEALLDGVSVRATAKLCGVGHCTVSAARKDLKEAGDLGGTRVSGPSPTA